MDKVALLERLWFLPITIFLLLFFIEITINFKKKAQKYTFDRTWMVIQSAHHGSFGTEYYNFLTNSLLAGSTVELRARRIRQKCIHLIVSNSEIRPWQLEKAFKTNKKIGNLEPHTRLYCFLKSSEEWVRDFMKEQPFIIRYNPIRKQQLLHDQFLEIINDFRDSWEKKAFISISDIT